MFSGGLSGGLSLSSDSLRGLPGGVNMTVTGLSMTGLGSTALSVRTKGNFLFSDRYVLVIISKEPSLFGLLKRCRSFLVGLNI